jgi:hypothetical protein
VSRSGAPLAADVTGIETSSTLRVVAASVPFTVPSVSTTSPAALTVAA